MIATTALIILATACAFTMGFAINQGSTCAVTASKELVRQHQASMLVGFAVATGAAGIICLPLSWIAGDMVNLVRGVPLSFGLLTGAILLGLGAVINDACLLGTVSRIGDGEVRFLALPLGLSLGFWAASHQHVLAAGTGHSNGFAEPGLAGIAVVACFLALLLACWRWLGGRRFEERGWPLRRAMVVLGICGTLLFAVTPGWTYADAVQRAVEFDIPMAMAIGLGAPLAGLAMLTGAVVSGLRARTFQYSRPTFETFARSIVGGAVMAFGATLVPGGNDTLLLASIPAATTSGIVAYLVMSLTVPLLLMGQKTVVSRRARTRSVT